MNFRSFNSAKGDVIPFPYRPAIFEHFDGGGGGINHNQGPHIKNKRWNTPTP